MYSKLFQSKPRAKIGRLRHQKQFDEVKLRTLQSIQRMYYYVLLITILQSIDTSAAHKPKVEMSTSSIHLLAQTKEHNNAHYWTRRSI